MKKRIVNHFLFWVLYWAFEVYTEFEWIQSTYHYPAAKAFLVALAAESLLVFLVKIPMVYLIFRIFDRYSLAVRNRPKLIGYTTILLVVFSIFSRTLTVEILFPDVYEVAIPEHFLQFQGLINSFMDIIFISGIAIALKQHSVSNRLMQREKSLQKEKLETELNFLKAQINPHFLFNTLNSIYALALKKSDDTADVVVKLSKLLRFVLYEAQAKTIAIDREIQFLKDYIELESIRYDQRLKVRFDFETDNPNTLIVPLLLVPFVENAFKHGASETTAEAFIAIDLRLKNNRLSFVVENSFESESNGHQEGIGLKNLRRQLELLYPDFDLHTESRIAGETVFKATLQLGLKPAP